MTTFEPALLEAMLRMLQRRGIPAVSVPAYRECSYNIGYCGTCSEIVTEVWVYYNLRSGSPRVWDFCGDFERLESAGGRVVSYRALRAASRQSGPGHPPVVYYMRQGDLVKIGTTTDIGSRSASIGAQGVMAIEPGDSAVEHRRHGEFAPERSHLEFFRLSAALAAHVVQVRARFEAETGLTTEAWLAPRLPRRRSTHAA